MKFQVMSIDGGTTDNIELSDKIFSIQPDKTIIQTIIYTGIEKDVKKNNNNKSPTYF